MLRSQYAGPSTPEGRAPLLPIASCLHRFGGGRGTISETTAAASFASRLRSPCEPPARRALPGERPRPIGSAPVSGLDRRRIRCLGARAVKCCGFRRRSRCSRLERLHRLRSRPRHPRGQDPVKLDGAAMLGHRQDRHGADAGRLGEQRVPLLLGYPTGTALRLNHQSSISA